MDDCWALKKGGPLERKGALGEAAGGDAANMCTGVEVSRCSGFRSCHLLDLLIQVEFLR